MRTHHLALLIVCLALCGCSPATLPLGTPNIDVDGFFRCTKCHCLYALNAGPPPTEIPAHATVCAEHAWQRITRNEYMERAISSHMEVALLPPVSDLTFPTAKGDTGLLVYRSGFVFRVGPSCYAISRHSAGLAAALAVAFLVALVILTQLWKKVKLRDAQQERCRQRR